GERPARSAVASDRSAGSGGGVGGVGVSFSLVRGAVLSLVQVHFGAAASAGAQPAGGDDPSVRSDDCQSVAESVARQEADETDVRDVLFVFQRLGDGGGIDGPLGEPQRSGRQFLLATIEPNSIGFKDTFLQKDPNK